MVFNSKKYIRQVPLLIASVGIILAVFYMLLENKVLDINSFKHVFHSLVITLGVWFGCFFITSYLWQKYPWEFYPIKHIIFELLAILIYTNLFCLLIYLVSVHCQLWGFVTYSKNLGYEIVVTNLITLFITLIHEAIFFYRQWKFNFSKSIQLEKENIESKYEMLKSQVNPHFLFNSLNSLSYIVDSNKEAITYIQNLSDFLRYSLQHRDTQLVSIEEEITMVQKYVDLQQTRFGTNLQVSIDLSIQQVSYFVPPLVVQMLVENCIKHNIISKEKKLIITIENSGDMLVVSNNLQKRITTDSVGQGLKNIEHRYSFFTTNKVIVENNNQVFRVHIPLLQINQ